MTIWRALRRIFAKHFLYHMVIPLFFGAVAEVLIVMTAGNRLSTAVTDLLTWQHVIPVLAIIGAYFVVMFFIVTKETSTPFETANFTKVEQQLRDATSYFALCDIPMREWFEPGAFEYFSLLQSKKQSDPAFRYERVIIFKSTGHKRDAEETILDRYYADALAMSHRKLKIPMGWLPPKELHGVLRNVKKEDQLLFRKIPAWLRWVPESILRRFPWPAQLDFAVIDRPAGQAVIIVPFKKAEAVVLEGPDATPYLRVADDIKSRVYEADKRTIRIDHDFPSLLD